MFEAFKSYCEGKKISPVGEASAPSARNRDENDDDDDDGGGGGGGSSHVNEARAIFFLLLLLFFFFLLSSALTSHVLCTLSLCVSLSLAAYAFSNLMQLCLLKFKRESDCRKRRKSAASVAAAE